jgi:hypothetical protein
MIDPVTPATLVPWRGKSYPLQLTNGCLAMAAGELDINILEGGPGSLFTKPAYYQNGVLLYAILRQKFPASEVSLMECLDAVTGEKSDFYADVLKKLVAELAPAIRRIMKLEAEPTDRPTTDANSGADSGPALASTSD